MTIVTIASFDMDSSYFASKENYFFPPILTDLGVTDDVVELMTRYNGLSKTRKKLLVAFALAINVPMILTFLWPILGLSILLILLAMVLVYVRFNFCVRGLLSEIQSKSKCVIRLD